MAKRKYVKENNLVKAINTDSLELQKPLVNEYYDINVHNSNMDKIDLGYKQNKNDISNINYELSKTENIKYTTENGIKEFSCKDGYVDNVVIEGETLVNLTAYDKGVRALTETTGNIWTTGTQYGSYSESNGVITFNTGSEKWTDFGSIVPVSEGSKIRFIVNMIENTEEGVNCIAMFFNSMPKTDVSGVNTDKIVSLVKKGTTTALGLRDNQFEVPQGATYALFALSFTSANATYKFSDFMLLENNEDKPITYFEGLKSVGQGDKIEVLTRESGKSNLLKTQTITYKDNYMLNYSNGLESASNNHKYTETYIEIEPNTDYCFYHVSRNICWYDTNKTLINSPLNERTFGVDKDLFYSAKSPNNAKYLRVTIIKNIHNNGETSEIYKGEYDKKQILTTLRSLPNGVKDTIEKRGNKYVKVQRCGEVVLNGSESEILLERTGTNTLGFVIKNCLTSHKNTWDSIVTDKFKTQVVYGQDLEGIQSNTSNPSWAHIGISKTKLSTQDVEGFKTWLKSNTVAVVYELETPIITELPNFNPQTYSDNTTLLINSGVIQANADFEVTNSLGSELEVLKSKTTNIEETFINHEHNYQKYKLTSDDGDCTEINNSDLNNLKKTGYYKGKNLTNAPTTGWSIVNIIVASGGVLQYCFTTYSTELRFRFYDTSKASWSIWQKVTTTSTLSLLEQQISELEIQLLESEV